MPQLQTGAGTAWYTVAKVALSSLKGYCALLQVFAPLARLLGLYSIKEELEALAFQYSDPDAHARVRQRLDVLSKQQGPVMLEVVPLLHLCVVPCGRCFFHPRPSPEPIALLWPTFVQHWPDKCCCSWPFRRRQRCRRSWRQTPTCSPGARASRLEPTRRTCTLCTGASALHFSGAHTRAPFIVMIHNICRNLQMFHVFAGVAAVGEPRADAGEMRAGS